VIDEATQALENADARTIVEALWSSWPIVVTLCAADVAMGDSPERHIDFIKALQELGDSGLITFEAFLVGPGGPQMVDAALTARGRALLGPGTNPAETVRQLAS
jgi:hypothetical protein